MRKIPTVFDRDWTGDRSRVVDKPNPACDWVFAGEGVATRKLDGTSCLIEGGKLWKRRELKKGEVPPEGFRLADHDEETGKTVGWMPVGEGPEDRFHREGFNTAPVASYLDGTYELLGPKIQGDPEGVGYHRLHPHADPALAVFDGGQPPRDFEGLRAWMQGRNIEGLVWHHPDGRWAKLKLRDFGIKRATKD